MSYLLSDLEKWAADRETVRLDREELNRKIDRRKHMLWHDAHDIKEGMMPPKEKIKPKFQTMKKGPFTSFTEDSDSSDKYLKKSNERQRRRNDFIMEKHRKINQAKYDAWGKEKEEMRASFERDLKKEKRNQLIKPIALAGAGVAAIGGGVYLYHRYKKKKRAEAEQEKTAGGEYDYFENLNEFKKYLKKNPETAKRRFSPDDFEYSEDYDEARDWHYSNYKASPEERKLLAEYQRTKKQDESMVEKTQEAYRSQHEKNLKRAKRLENIGLRVGLGGAGLAAFSAYSKKLPEKYRMPLGLGGMGLVAGSMIPSGKGEYLKNKSYEKYNQPMNDFNKRQEARDNNIAYQKYLRNRNEHWAFGVDDEQEKTAWVQKLRLDKEVMNHEVNMRKHRLWEDVQDIELGIMQPKEKIKPKFRTMEKRRFNQFTEDSDRSNERADQMYDRQMRRQEVRMERIKAERKANEAKYKIQEQANQKEWDQFFADTKKSESRRRVKPIALAGAGAAAIGGGAYLYNRYKKKKRAEAEQEKTAGDVVDFASHAKKIADRNALKAKFVNPEDPIRKAQGAIQEYLDKEKEWQAESKARKSKIAELEMGIKSDMEQLRQMDEQEAKVKLRNKKIAKGVGIAGAGLATLGGGAHLYNRYKKKKRARNKKRQTKKEKGGVE